MPKLPTITSSKLLSILKKNKFEIIRTSGSHYLLYNSHNKKKITLPFHRKDIPKGTLLVILKEAGLSKSDLGKK